MLITWLNGYGPSNLEALLMLVAIGALVVAGYWLLRRRGQHEVSRLQSALAEAQRQGEQFQSDLAEARRQRDLDEARHQSELDEVRAHYDPIRIKELQDHFERVIAHEFKSGLFFIATQCREAVAGLRADQPDLRIMLNDVGAKTYEMMQLVKIIVGLEGLERKTPHWEMLRTRGVLEKVVKEQLPHAETRDVHLQIEYGSLGPILTDRLLLQDLCTAVIDNAIDYSFPGGVVEITQRLEDESGKQMFIDVRDHGRGIEAKAQERIFELNVRGDGLVVPGSGLGLYYARKIARLLGGDLVLGESKVNEGSTFRIILPYAERSDIPQPDTASKGEAP
jgi:signal transduction histidine kinase